MADWTQRIPLAASDVSMERLTRDGHGGWVVAFGGSAITVYYKMRALDDTQSYYVTWVVSNEPDPLGTYAPEEIYAGSAVAAARWTDPPTG